MMKKSRIKMYQIRLIGHNFKFDKTVIGFKSYSRVCRCSSQVYFHILSSKCVRKQQNSNCRKKYTWLEQRQTLEFESDDSFIGFEIGTNQFNLVQFYSSFLLHILHFLTLSIFSGQDLFNLRLHLQYSTFNSKLQLHFNLKL